MKPKIRMVGLDLDGTVFNNNKEISTHTRSVLKEAIRQGCIVLPATGRPEIGLPGAFLEIPGVEYALTSNGARIIRIPSGETVYEEVTVCPSSYCALSCKSRVISGFGAV